MAKKKFPYEPDASDILSAIYSDFESYFQEDFFKEYKPSYEKQWKRVISKLPTSLKGKKTIFSKFIKPVLKFKPKQKDGFYYKNSKQLKQKYKRMKVLYQVKGAGDNVYTDTFSWDIKCKDKKSVAYFKKYIYNEHRSTKGNWYFKDVIQENVCQVKGLQFVRWVGFYAV